MLIAWFIISALLTSIVFVLEFMDVVEAVKNFNRQRSLAIILLAISAVCVANYAMGIACLIQHISYTPEKTRCSSIESGVYERDSRKCYVNGEEK